MSKYQDRINIENIKRKTIECKECGEKMCVDDVDYRFDGCYDVYYNCTFCATSCITEVRFGQPYIENWHSENDGNVRDIEIKHKINIPPRK